MTQPPWFTAILAKYPRVAISGGPRAGKSSLASTVTDRPVFGTDSLMNLKWSDVPDAVIKKAATLGDRFIVEGVQVPRALRKGLEVDVVVHLDGHHGAVTTGQMAMGKAIGTVLEEWYDLAQVGERIPVIRRKV